MGIPRNVPPHPRLPQPAGSDACQSTPMRNRCRLTVFHDLIAEANLQASPRSRRWSAADTAAHVFWPHRDLRCRARFSLGAVYLSERAGLYGASFILTGFTDANDNPKQILKSPEAE